MVSNNDSTSATNILWHKAISKSVHYFLYRLLFWSFLFIPVILIYASGIISVDTPIPKEVLSFVKNLSSPLYFLVLLIVNIITSGVACLFSAKVTKSIMALSINDSGNIFIELAAFWFWLGVLISAETNNHLFFISTSLGSSEFFGISLFATFVMEWIKFSHCVFDEKNDTKDAVPTNVSKQGSEQEELGHKDQ